MIRTMKSPNTCRLLIGRGFAGLDNIFIVKKLDNENFVKNVLMRSKADENAEILSGYAVRPLALAMGI